MRLELRSGFAACRSDSSRSERDEHEQQSLDQSLSMSTERLQSQSLLFDDQQNEILLSKNVRVRLQPASGHDLPAYNPILPAQALTQIILLADPHRVSQTRFTGGVFEESSSSRNTSVWPVNWVIPSMANWSRKQCRSIKAFPRQWILSRLASFSKEKTTPISLFSWKKEKEDLWRTFSPSTRVFRVNKISYLHSSSVCLFRTASSLDE